MPKRPDCQRWRDGKRDEECHKLFREYETHEAMIEMWAVRAVTEYSSIADLIAFVHLLRWPVAEPDRSASSLAHLERMVELSRETGAASMPKPTMGANGCQTRGKPVSSAR